MDTSEQKFGTEENIVEEIIGTANKNMELEKSTSMMAIKASDDNENKEQKSKESLKFCGWLLDVLDWIKRTELAQSSLSTSSYAFNRYCWLKLHGRMVKPHTIWRLDFYREKDDAGNWHKFLRKDRKISIPIADINPPEYIIGLENIYFHFVDNQVVQFLQAILPLLNDDLEIQFFRQYRYKPEIHPVDDLMALLAPKTEKLKLFNGADFYVLDGFNQLFPNFISCLRSIYLNLDIHRGCREEDLDLVVKWLSEPREDCKTKMLQIDFYYYQWCTYHTIIRRIKKEFSKAKKSSNFVIRLKFFKMKEESMESLSDESKDRDDDNEEMEDEEENDEMEDEEENDEMEDEEENDEMEDEEEDSEMEDDVKDEGDERTNEDEDDEKKAEREVEDEEENDEMEDEVKGEEDKDEEKKDDANKGKNEDLDYFKMLDFKIENEVTGEILELKYKSYGDYFLVRHKKGNEIDEAELVNWKNEFERKSTTIIWMVSF